MKKMEYAFGGGEDTVFFSVEEKKFFSAEKDRFFLHRKYAGKAYYTSRTGSTGAGFFKIPPDKNDLVEMGRYRVDARTLPIKKFQFRQLDETGFGHRDIAVYVPYASHRGLCDGPIVLADKTRVEFHPSECFGVDILKNFGKEIAQKKELTYWDVDQDDNDRIFQKKWNWEFLNSHHLGKIDALQFLEHPQSLIIDFSNYAILDCDPANITGFLKIGKGIVHFVVSHNRQIIDGYWEGDVLPDGYLVRGWTKRGGMLWQRRGDEIFVLRKEEQKLISMIEFDFEKKEQN